MSVDPVSKDFVEASDDVDPEPAPIEITIQAIQSRPLPQVPGPAPAAGTWWYCPCVKLGTRRTGLRFYGASATFSIYRPRVEERDHSLMQIAIINDEIVRQTVEAGWRRAPGQANGKGEAQLFVYFTTNNYASSGPGLGGYDTVLTSTGAAAPLGTSWVPASGNPSPQPGDRLPYSQLDIARKEELQLKWQLSAGQWNLIVGGRWIGGYPAALFSASSSNPARTLADHANQVWFYGEVYDSNVPDPRTTTSEMGSGKFPESGRGKSAYIRNMEYQRHPTPTTVMTKFDGSARRNRSFFDPRRYDMKELFTGGIPSWGSYVLLGGPGRRPHDWVNWDTVGNGNKVESATFQQGGPITALSRKPDVIDLFMVGSNGKVYTSWWTTFGRWSGFDDKWMAIGGLNFPVTSKVTAVARKSEILDLFIVGSDGRVYTNWWTLEGGWNFSGDWQALGGSFPTTAQVVAVHRSPNNLDLFVCDGSGQVQTTAWEDGVRNWPAPTDNWDSISQLDTFPAAAKVSAVARGKDHLEVFVCASDGQVAWATWSSTTPWSGFSGPWARLGQGAGNFPLASSVAAISRTVEKDIVDLFVVGNDGHVYTSWWTRTGGWLTPGQPWEDIGGSSSFSPGYDLAALARKPDIIDLFICGTDGQVYTSWWTRGNAWSGIGNNWRKLGGSFALPQVPGAPLVAAQVDAVARTQANLSIFAADSTGRIGTTFWAG